MSAPVQSLQPSKDEALLATCEPVILAKLVLELTKKVEHLQGTLREALCELSVCAEQMNARKGGSVDRAIKRARAALPAGETGR